MKRSWRAGSMTTFTLGSGVSLALRGTMAVRLCAHPYLCAYAPKDLSCVRTYAYAHMMAPWTSQRTHTVALAILAQHDVEPAGGQPLPRQEPEHPRPVLPRRLPRH